jgi:MshEN domain
MSTPLRERPDAPLGTLIFRAGLLPAETIENALEEGVKTGRRLGEILVERNLIKEEDLTRLLAGQKGLPYVSLRERAVEVDAARLLAEDQARLFTALPIGFEDGVPVVAVADPTNDVLNRNIREALGQEARFVVVARSELNAVIGEVFSGSYNGATGDETVAAVDEAPAEFDTRVPAPDFEEDSIAPEPELEVASPEAWVEAEPAFDAPAPAAAAEPDYEPDLEPEPELPAAADEPEAVAEPEPFVEPETVVELEPEVVAEPKAFAEPEAFAEPDPVVEQEPLAEPEPVAAAYEAPTPAPEPLAEPAVDPEPVLEAPVIEPQPEPVPLATEPVAADSVPPTNGRVPEDHLPEDFEDDSPPPAPPAAATGYRVSIRLTSGEKLTVADCEDIGEAKGYAKALTKQLGATESDDWPFVNGRFLKPDTIVSVDLEELG